MIKLVLSFMLLIVYAGTNNLYAVTDNKPIPIIVIKKPSLPKPSPTPRDYNGVELYAEYDSVTNILGVEFLEGCGFTEIFVYNTERQLVVSVCVNGDVTPCTRLLLPNDNYFELHIVGTDFEAYGIIDDLH